MDPGFAEISDEKSIMVTFEVRSIAVDSSQHEHILKLIQAYC